MEKVVVVSCTNRLQSNTLKVSRIYLEILRSRNVDAKLLDFCTLPKNIAFSETFGKRSARYAKLIDKYISTQQCFVFVVPEYNGSFPGILKIFLDSVHPREWANKNVCLVGVADGRAGNLRGLEHLTGILHYLKMHVYHNKLPISVIGRIMDKKGKFSSDDQMKASVMQMEDFLKIRTG